MSSEKQIISEINQKKVKPIYFLMGDEPYFIDSISQYFAKNLLDESEKDFNQTIIYGKDTNIDTIISLAKRYPMMAERQLIIIKEAQHLSATIEKLDNYATSPLDTTTLVFCYKQKKLDKRKKLYKLISKNGIIFESKKLYENQVAPWIKNELNQLGYSTEPNALQLILDALGTDLGKISKELEKLKISLPKSTVITINEVQAYIGINKDFNNFELRKAIGEKNFNKSVRIIKYFGENPKHHPIMLTISQLFSFFSQLIKYHGLNDKSKNNVAKVLGVNPFFVSEYVTAARNYSIKRISYIISSIREIDLKSKGVNANQISQIDLLKELLINIFIK